MRTKKAKGVVLAALSFFCGAAIVGGVMAQKVVGANAEETVLFERNFDSLSVNATGDEIYGATYVAGANRSVVEAEKDYIEAIYTFFDNGCQHAGLYLDSNRGIPSTDVNKTYMLELEFQTFGSSVKNMILGLQAPDGAYNGVVKVENGVAIAENYGSVSDFITVASATQDANGWWKATIQLKGTGGYIFPIFWMNIDPAKYEEVNAALDTGIRVSEFKVTEGENTIYDLTVTPGLIGSDALFGATGFAGGTSVVTKEGAGIEGKSIKAVYTFWDNGFQHEPLYVNENAVNARLENGTQYLVEMDVEKFGNVEQVYCIFNQMGIDGTTDSQIVLEKNGSHNVYEYGTVKMFENIEVEKDGETYHIKAIVNGAGGLLKFSFNMLSNNYEDSNTNMNTGLYLDNVKIAEKSVESDDESTLPSDWKTMYAQNFNKADPSLSGSDAFFHATGFAGVEPGTLTIDNAIDGSQCAKVTYAYWEDDYGWQKQSFYLNSGYTSNTSTDSYYKASMKIKPFGEWTAISVGFQDPSNVAGWLTLNPDGSFVVDKVGCLVDAEVTVENGIYTVNAYLKGTGSWIFNMVNMAAANPVEANANKDTGLYFDDYVFAKEVQAVPAGLNKKVAYYNKATEADFVTATTFTAIDSVAIGEMTLSAEQYTFADGMLTIKESALDAIANGTYTVTVATGDVTVEMELVIAFNPLGSVYNNDFAGMPELAGGQDAKDNFFFNSYFDPANYNIWTVDEGENRIIKFVAPEANDAFVAMFQTNPQEARLNSLCKDKVHTVYMDLKPENGTIFGVEGRIFDGLGVDVPSFYMEIDVAANQRVDGNTQYSNVSWAVTEKENGWYTLAITFSYTGDYSEKAAAYLRFSAPASEQDVWYFDNFDAQSELIPELRAEKNTYDVGANTAPYYIVDLYGAFEIESIMVNGAALSANDYTAEVTPVGYLRIDFAKEYCANYTLGEELTVVIKTTKGNEIVSKLVVVDSRPTMADSSFDYDKATVDNVAVMVDFKGYELASVMLGETTLTGTEYNYIAASGVVDFKGAYLSKLGVGNHVFTMMSSSGANCQFTLVVSDSTPKFGTVNAYEKSQGGNYVVDIELNGKDIVSVSFAGLTLTTEQYGYANGKLTINESVMAGLAAGQYNLTVTTIISATVDVTVNDAPPVFSGEYTASQGVDLVVNVETYNKKIVSVKVDGLTLLADEYSYANGKLTIKSAVFEEIAVGERTLVLTTEGGEATLTFTLQVAGAGDEDNLSTFGCNSSIGTLSAGVLALAAVAIILKKKKD